MTLKSLNCKTICLINAFLLFMHNFKMDTKKRKEKDFLWEDRQMSLHIPSGQKKKKIASLSHTVFEINVLFFVFFSFYATIHERRQNLQE